MTATKAMAAYCFDVVLAKLENKDPPRFPLTIEDQHV